MNKEKIAIYEELIDWANEQMPLGIEIDFNEENEAAIKRNTLEEVISHLKGRIEELKKDEKSNNLDKIIKKNEI